jgi:subtilisin family serine protease
VGGPANPFREPRPFFPAAFDNVVAVAAARPSAAAPDGWEPADFSNFGAWVDFAAPGVDVESTFVEFTPGSAEPDGPVFRGWARWSGSSFSTGIVSGAIAATMTDKQLSAREAVAYLRKADLPQVTFGADVSVPLVAQASWPASP